MTRGWEDTQPGQLTPADQRDTPYRRLSRSEIKLERSISKVVISQELAGHHSAGVE